ncbi:facilitated trehalose transporter Tret1-like isoform X2 [Aphidius gifuensis]|nr:facilitated trehalose transporter Tret1-like isoform X2 [Aphidius gifuensis]
MLMDSQLQMELKSDNELAKKNNKSRSKKGRSKLDVEIIKYPSQVIAALSVSLGSMVVGFSSAYSSPGIDSMNQTAIFRDEINTNSASWIGSILPLLALFGGIAGGPFIEYLGRKRTILATAFPFIIGWLTIAMAQNVITVYIGRGICGFCVGVASLSLPVYLGETIQAEVRGTLGLLPTAFGNVGILLCFTSGMFVDWSTIAYIGAGLSIPYLALMFGIPETPRWYISKGKVKEARKSLQWLRGKNVDISDELSSIEDANANCEKHSAQSPVYEMLKKKNLKPLLISLGLMFFQQFSGINAVIFYTVQIFEMAGSSVPKNTSTIIVGIVNFASTFIATALIDRLGRKVLLYISTIAMITTLFSLGTFFYIKEKYPDVDIINYGWVPLTSLVIFVIGFSLGFGPIPWLMMGEILPASIRGPAASVATAFNWFIVFTVTKTFQDTMSAIGAGPTFWIFGAICCVALIFVIIWVPETRGRSLEEIEKGMSGPVRRMSAVANMKPMPAGC